MQNANTAVRRGECGGQSPAPLAGQPRRIPVKGASNQPASLAAVRVRRLIAGLCCAAALSFCSSARAQQNSLFGGAGPLSGQVGFGTATTGAPFGVGSSAGPLSTSAFPGGQVAGGGRRTGGLGLGLGTPGGMTQPHEFPVPRVGQQDSMFPGMGQAALNWPGSNPNQIMFFNPANQVPYLSPANPLTNPNAANPTTYVNPTNRMTYLNPASQMAYPNAPTGVANPNAANQQIPSRRAVNRGAQTNVNPANQSRVNRNPAARRRPIRPAPVVTIHPAQSANGAAGSRNAATVADQLAKLSSQPGFEGVTARLEGGKVVLRGQVDSLEAKRLASIVARLQPGVDSVVNQLQVKGAYD